VYVAGRSLTSSSPARTTSPNRPFCATRLLETERSFDTWCAFTVASDAEMVNADIVRTPSETFQYVDDADAIRPSGRAVRALRPSRVSFPPFRRRGAHGESLLAIEPPGGEEVSARGAQLVRCLSIRLERHTETLIRGRGPVIAEPDQSLGEHVHLRRG